MTRMMQPKRLDCYRCTALFVLLTLILHDRLSTVFGITVNPLDSVIDSRIDADEYIDIADQSSEFGADIHNFNSINFNQFAKGYNKLAASQGISDAGQYGFGSTVGTLNHAAITKQHIAENQSDAFSEALKMFSIHHSVFEVPNFFNNRISIRSRIVPSPASLPIRPKLVRPPPSPITAISDGIKDRLKAIYPGTLWCGDGNHAKNQNVLGLFRNTDICCKQHDECPAFIKSGSEFKGLRNTGLFTRSHCDCDMKFYNCLKRTDTIISSKIGYTYFNILRPKCFRKEFPIVGCKKWVNKKCYVYMVDDQRSPVWQWFENKLF